jgi:hypothetical protein
LFAIKNIRISRPMKNQRLTPSSIGENGLFLAR